MSYAPESMYLMHYSRVTDTPRLAEMLKSQIREFVRIVRTCEALPDPHNAIRASMLELWLNLLQQHGSTCAVDDVTKLLESDLELNSQGLLIWFARQRRSNSSDKLSGVR
jgi:hypothetical protein